MTNKRTEEINQICEQNQPGQYNDKVDLRIIVITLDRSASLLKLLQSIDFLKLDGDSAALEIWIDRSRTTSQVNMETVKVASNFQWSKGPTRVHVHATAVGLYGQWIDTWRPADNSDDEIALFLEDDLSISKYAYRWLRAVFQAYGNRTNFAGASLASNQMIPLSTKRRKRILAGPVQDTVLMYKAFGSWGFAPKPMHWKRFQVS